MVSSGWNDIFRALSELAGQYLQITPPIFGRCIVCNAITLTTAQCTVTQYCCVCCEDLFVDCPLSNLPPTPSDYTLLLF